MEGHFTSTLPAHAYFMENPHAAITAEILNCMQPLELGQIKLSHQVRRQLLLKYVDYYKLHIADFGQMRSLDILHEVLG